MKLGRFDRDRLGLVVEDNVLDVTFVLESLEQPRWFRGFGDPLIEALPRIREILTDVPVDLPVHNRRDIRFEHFVTCPSKILAAPANYRAHIDLDASKPEVNHGVHHQQVEGMSHPPLELGLFLKATSSLGDELTGVHLPADGRRIDHEVELGVVIGRQARKVDAASALEYVAGYCISLDITVRGKEERSYRKSADTFATIGPWLTTVDEIPDPSALELWLTVNGDERQRSGTDGMLVNTQELIELASSMYTLFPGDIIMTGTPAGVSELHPGDVVVAGCAGLGELIVNVTADR
ncbi:fumarylacetoacetate hydrolase family protein [Pedococcus sp. P5_B7]